MKHTFTLIALALSLSAAACGGATIPPPSHAQAESSQEEVSRYRGVLAQIKANPLAKNVASDIDRAEEWLETAKQLATDNRSSARLRLYLDAVHAQLVMVQSHYAREEARKSAGMKDKDAAPRVDNDATDDEDTLRVPPKPQASTDAVHVARAERTERNDSTGDDL